jgi:hypothetical protein
MRRQQTMVALAPLERAVDEDGMGVHRGIIDTYTRRCGERLRGEGGP